MAVSFAAGRWRKVPMVPTLPSFRLEPMHGYRNDLITLTCPGGGVTTVSFWICTSIPAVMYSPPAACPSAGRR